MHTKPYARRAQYYETDAMGIVHHSNYIRWFEEARIDFMDQLGFTYAQMEADGIGSVILSVQCEYKKPVRFAQDVVIHTHITTCKGVRMGVEYQVVDVQSGEVCATGTTQNCFINGEGRPIALKKALPHLYELFVSTMENEG